MTKCGPCGKEFKTFGEYLDHKCEKADGYTPRDKEYVIKTTCPNFDKVSQSAVERGKVKKEKKDKKEK